MSYSEIFRAFDFVIFGVLILGGLFLLLAPKRRLEKFAEQYDLISRFGRVVGAAMSFRREDGTLITRQTSIQCRITGGVILVFGVWMFWGTLR